MPDLNEGAATTAAPEAMGATSCQVRGPVRHDRPEFFQDLIFSPFKLALSFSSFLTLKIFQRIKYADELIRVTDIESSFYFFVDSSGKMVLLDGQLNFVS